MDSLSYVLKALLAKKEITFQDKHMDDVTIRLFSRGDVMIEIDGVNDIKAERLTIGRKIDKKKFLPEKIDVLDFIDIPHHMSLDNLTALNKALKSKK